MGRWQWSAPTQDVAVILERHWRDYIVSEAGLYILETSWSKSSRSKETLASGLKGAFVHLQLFRTTAKLYLSTGPRQNVGGQQFFYREPAEAFEAVLTVLIFWQLTGLGSAFYFLVAHLSGGNHLKGKFCSFVSLGLSKRKPIMKAAIAPNSAQVGILKCVCAAWTSREATEAHASWLTRFDLILSAQMRWFVQMSLTDWVWVLHYFDVFVQRTDFWFLDAG